MSWSKTRTMNSSRYSELGSLLLAVVVIATIAVPAAAVSVDGTGVPDAVETNETVGIDSELSFRLTDLYTEYQSYELVGQTQLREAVWTVETINPQGETIDTQTFSGTNFTIDVGGSVDAIEVSLEGRAPTADAVDFQYEPAQSVVIANFAQRQSGGVASEIREITARPYTSDSQAARDAIDAAGEAIDAAQSAGAGADDAQTDYDNAVEAFNNEEFGLAQDLAEQSQSAAESAQSSQNQMELLLTIGAAIVVIAIIAGVIVYVLRNRGPADKLG